jgi:glycosyltransferase involved in cell wall biosynthesis
MTTTLYFALTAEAAGNRALDPRDPTGGAKGGGSPAGFLGLVRAMGRLDKYAITAFGPFRERRTTVDGVEYVRITETGSYDPPDVMFAYYDTMPLIGNPARLRIASHHTCLPYHSWPYNDVNLAPSQWAVDHLRSGYRPHCRWSVLPNAVEGLDGVEWKPVSGRVLWHTSNDRGLHLLLNAWPQIRERVPEATLHVVGDPDEVIKAGEHVHLIGSYEWKRGAAMLQGIEAATKAGGLKLIGRLPRPALLKEIASATCVALPFETSSPCETFSISVLESLTIGVPVVMSPVDALESIYRDSGVEMVGSPAREHMGAFVNSVVRVLTEPERAADMSAREREWSKRFSFDESALVLDEIIRRELPRTMREAPREQVVA